MFVDLAHRLELGLSDIEDWTPGMILDLATYRANDIEEKNKPKPPDQAVFDNF